MSTEVSSDNPTSWLIFSEKRRIERETKKDERNYNERGTSSSAHNESFSSANWDRVNEERVSLLKGINPGALYQPHDYRFHLSVHEILLVVALIF